MRGHQAPQSKCAAERNYKQMNDLSKDAVSWHTVGDDGAGQRIDNYLLKVLKGVPKSHVYRILRSGEVRLNRRRAGPETRLEVGDHLRIPPIRTAEPSATRVVPGVPLGPTPPVLYEDDAIIVLDKPSGLAVHGGSGVSQGVIERLRLARPAAPFLELVHRLDRDTSGVLLIAKKRAALTTLHAALREGEVDKRYLVLVRGKWRDALRRVSVPLENYLTGEGERRVRAASGGREARTTLRRIMRLGESRAAGRPAGSGTGDGSHAPDQGAPRAPRASPGRGSEIRGLRVEPRTREAGPQAAVPARLSGWLPASADREPDELRGAAGRGAAGLHRHAGPKRCGGATTCVRVAIRRDGFA